MSAVLESHPTTDHSRALSAIRTRLRETTAKQERVAVAAERCRMDIAKHEVTLAAVPTAQAALIDLHAGRAAGESVSEKAITNAEGSLKQAQALAEKASSALAGTRAALAKLDDEAVTLNQEVQKLRADAKLAQGAILRDRAAASRQEFRVAAAAFAANAYANHHATLAAIRAVAEELQLLTRLDLPGPVEPTCRIAGTATVSDSGAWDFDVTEIIESKATAIRKSLNDLTL